ncbi:uncharacterized protein LOC119572554 [Penaeus monodon]|uniref:uncharacterized protein LOC119572554 n=1 Tax=Penaeus monodon TaxID=6687 RepID=UPI0018A75A5F|nr:uncharacterized protein LOC119572554 [Penaeus monodon]
MPYLGYSSDPIETSHNTTDPIDILYESETRWPRTNRSTVNFPRNLRDELPYWRDEAEALDQAVDQGGSHGFLRFLQDVIQRGGSNGCKSEVRCGEELCGFVPRFLFTQDIPVLEAWWCAMGRSGLCERPIINFELPLSSLPGLKPGLIACLKFDLTKSRVAVVMGSWRKTGNPTRLVCL